MKEPSIELNNLIFTTLDHAIVIIEDSSPLIPFLISRDHLGEQNLTRFSGELLEEQLKAAQKYVQKEKDNISAYAIAWDGFLNFEGKKWDSILVEAGDNIAKHGILLAQRYENQSLLKKKNKPVGNPALIGRPVSRIYRT